MCNAGVINVKTIISTCDIIFYYLVLLPGGLNLISCSYSVMARCDDLLLIMFSVHVIMMFIVRDDSFILQLICFLRLMDII